MPIYNNSEQEIEELQAALVGKSPTNHTHAPEAWQNLTLASGWSNYGAGYATPQIRKHVGSLIEVKGTIKKSSAAVPNETIIILPVGYRPAETSFFITWTSSGYSRLEVQSSGAIKLISGNNIGVGLNFIFGLN